jgi:hypothetical protein
MDGVKKDAEGPYVAVCGKCNLAIDLHPVKNCPYTYKPVVLNGRRYGWMLKRGEEKAS